MRGRARQGFRLTFSVGRETAWRAGRVDEKVQDAPPLPGSASCGLGKARSGEQGDHAAEFTRVSGCGEIDVSSGCHGHDGINIKSAHIRDIPRPLVAFVEDHAWLLSEGA